MKIVIDLPQKVIDRLRSNYGHGVKCLLGDNDKDIVVDAIYNCVYLPERHGDLIDRDEIEFGCKEGLCLPKYVGYSSHDDESRYQCPICKEGYGSWDFINGSVRVMNGLFRCKCGQLLKKPE